VTIGAISSTKRLRNLVAVGDSIVQGFGATQSFAAILASKLGCSVSNQGVGSAGWNVESGGVFGGTGNLTALAAANVDPLLSSLALNGLQPDLVLFAGLNDIRDGASPAAAFATFQTYYNARISAGWSAGNIFVCTLLIAGITGAGQLAYNNLLYQGGFNLIRFDGDSNMGSASYPTNALVCQADNIHPTDLGHTVLASICYGKLA
jgi:lysophospholipase L1-like esterase